MPVKRIEPLEEFISTVKVKRMGNIEEHTTIQNRNSTCQIKKLDSETYVLLSTGEVFNIDHIENRSESYQSIRRTMTRILEIINTNITEPKKTNWVTLTYSQHMTDTKRLYKDYDRFWKRFLYYTFQMGYWQEVKPEYIAIAEPQGTGSWHLHLFIIWDRATPFIANDENTFEMIGRERYSGEKTMSELWKQGFTKTQKVRDTTNPGAYFTTYLTDLPLDEVDQLSSDQKNEIYKTSKGIKEKSLDDDQGNKSKKKFVKGARLVFYPPGFNIIRSSKGIKEPEVSITSPKTAKEQVKGAILTYSCGYEITDDQGNVVNRIYKKYYNHNPEQEKKGVKRVNKTVKVTDLTDQEKARIARREYAKQRKEKTIKGVKEMYQMTAEQLLDQVEKELKYLREELITLENADFGDLDYNDQEDLNEDLENIQSNIKHYEGLRIRLIWNIERGNTKLKGVIRPGEEPLIKHLEECRLYRTTKSY